ncbi:unnamed protein product [Prorocentrum cordatum]|uniref:Bifunctional lysine-specific demethylase and histidyl-hydroxylase n=1 Tax=Prorocentrum cordatum TaxID=2364126 RepID=A0ABN9RX83_9DINO|nr:unnamed protein product [Polarella glacialis]
MEAGVLSLARSSRWDALDPLGPAPRALPQVRAALLELRHLVLDCAVGAAAESTVDLRGAQLGIESARLFSGEGVSADLGAQGALCGVFAASCAGAACSASRGALPQEGSRPTLPRRCRPATWSSGAAAAGAPRRGRASGWSLPCRRRSTASAQEGAWPRRPMPGAGPGGQRCSSPPRAARWPAGCAGHGAGPSGAGQPCRQRCCGGRGTTASSSEGSPPRRRTWAASSRRRTSGDFLNLLEQHSAGARPALGVLRTALLDAAGEALREDLGAAHGTLTVLLLSSWLNRNGRGDSNQAHTHRADLSGVVYLRCGRCCYLHFPGAEHCLQPGDMMLFSPGLPHWVPPSEDDGPRISIAFNLGVDFERGDAAMPVWFTQTRVLAPPF